MATEVDRTLASPIDPDQYLAAGDRDEMPGTLVRGMEQYPQHLEYSKRKKGALVRQQCASKVSTRTLLVDNTKTYQLLPQDMMRKVAHIKILLTAANGILLGPDPVVENGGGYPLLNGDPEMLYTGGSPLSCKGTSATQVQVNLLIEQYDGETAIN
jgi:hypothetical protein